jgi:hypothetical protein
MLLLLALAFAVSATVCAPVADAARKPTCKWARSKTVRQNDIVRVYEVRKGEYTTLYGCRKSTGKHMKLDVLFDDGYVLFGSYSKVRLNRWHVAWFSTFTDISCKAACPPGYDSTKSSIHAADVRTRRSRSIAGTPVGKALVVSRTGGVAWASQAGPGAPVEIRASDAGGERVVDSGNIDAASLAIELTIVSWKHNGIEQFARLR